MKRSLVIVSLFALTLGCGESTSESGQTREPEEVIVDAFNVALAGSFIPYEAERRPVIAEAIAAHDADILCLQEVWTQEDKELIRDTAVDNYPYAAFTLNDLDTMVDDPSDQNGQVPPAPVGVPCPDVEVSEGLTIFDQMNGAVDCVSANCSTEPGSEDGRTTSADCAAAACTPEVAGLLIGNAEQLRCYACIIPQLPTATFGEIRSSCATVPNQDLAFGGQNGVMILSRHPLANTENWVIPGTWNRRSILRATVELPNGAELDTYCNHLTPIFNDFVFPYTGQYGDGMRGAAGWQAEQELQTEKLIAYVDATNGGRPSVILGDFNAGLAFPADGIVAEGEATFELLAAAFTPAYTSDYAPLCTFCSTNPVTNPDDDPEATSVWIDHILLQNLTADAVLSTSRIFDEDVVPVESDAGEIMVPLSDHFGMRSVLVVP
jgi:endonuclease/exonuclease/phosphatase family metal-dependent hydrolase